MRAILIGTDEIGHSEPLVYFVRREDTGDIKIGITSGIKLRINALIQKLKVQVTILGAIPGNLQTEMGLHSRFAEYHLGGEWFSPVPTLLDFINQEVPELEFKRSPRGRNCQGKTTIGLPCNAAARANSEFCYHHQEGK